MHDTAFTIIDSCGPSAREQLLNTVVFFGPFVVMGLLRWLRRSPRDARDVLGSAIVPPAGSIFQRLLDVCGGWLQIALALLLPALITAGVHAAMFYSREGSVDTGRYWVLDPAWPWSAVAVLVFSGGFLLWLRRPPSSEPDVLRPGARA